MRLNISFAWLELILANALAVDTSLLRLRPRRAERKHMPQYDIVGLAKSYI